MSTVRRIQTDSSTLHIPRFRLIETQPRPTHHLLKAILWVGAILVCLLTVGGGVIFAAENVTLTPLPASLESLPIYPGAHIITPAQSKRCSTETALTTVDSKDQVFAFY